MKRIALVITELHPGGAEKCCVQLATYLKQQDIDVGVFQLWPPPPTNQTQLVEQLDAHRIPWKSGGAVRPWDFPKAIRWLRSELKSFSPDVVQSFLFHANLATALAIGGLDCKFFGGARVRQPERWRQWAQRWSARRMDRLVCVSQSVEKHCRSVERIPAERLTTIPNGIEIRSDVELSDVELSSVEIRGGDERTLPNDQLAQHAEVPHQAPILLFVGRLVPQKGIETLIQHSQRLLEGLPEHHLVCVGEGSSRPRLEELKKSSPAGDRLHLIGWQPNPLQWMQRCELLLLPAIYEGMPNVVLEAMSVAKPIVAFDVDGLEELLGNDHEGKKQRVAPGNIHGFIDTTLDLARTPTLARELGRRNRARAAASFQLDDQFAKYLELYER